MKLFQIHEDDLETLERELPNIALACETSPGYNQNQSLKEALQMVKAIVSNVRWNYGPSKEVHQIEPPLE